MFVSERFAAEEEESGGKKEEEVGSAKLSSRASARTNPRKAQRLTSCRIGSQGAYEPAGKQGRSGAGGKGENGANEPT
jgi:hypothetical protein